MRRRTAALSLLSPAALACIALFVACRHADPAPAAATSTEEPAAAVPALPASEFHETLFDLVVHPAAPYTAGKAGVAEIEVSAKGGFHCNDKYPYKFKIRDSAGVHFAAPVFDKDAVHLEPMRATMQIAFTPESSGPKTLGGTFAFSLCSADRCLVEKRDLALTIAVN